MEGELGYGIAALGFYILGNYFSSVQSAFFCFPKPARNDIEEKHGDDPRTPLVVGLLGQPRRTDLSLRILVVTLRVLFVISMYVALAGPLTAWLGLPTFAIVPLAAALTLVVWVPGEMLSRSYGIQQAQRVVFNASRIVIVLQRFIGAPCEVFVNVLRSAANRFGIKRAIPYLTVEELMAIVEAGEEEGEFQEEEREMIHSIFELGDTTVREVMVPRVDMIAIEKGSPLTEVLVKITEGGHSRIPVYEESIDKIIGVVYAKDLLKIAQEDKWEMPAHEMMRDAFFVPEGKPVDDLLREFRTEKVHLAVVVDEYGGTAGLVTLEDVIEEIVGEIQDEYDDEDPLFEPAGPDSARVDARISLEQLNKLFDLSLPNDDRHDTLGGYLYTLVERVPAEGETVSDDKLDFTVESTDRQRISIVRIQKRPEPDAEEEEAETLAEGSE